MNELELLQRLLPTLATNPTVVVPAGDDCAVLDLGLPGELLLFKTDAVVEGVHFQPHAVPEKIGHKALARCLSDIAAMAGVPSSALVTMALPNGWDADRVERIYAGLNALAHRYGVALAGGEIVSNPERLLISVALLGRVPTTGCVRRSGAQPGDAIFVTGTLGGSLEGKHLDFEPRLTEAQWLRDRVSLHAMIDLSDGLASDLRHILQASQVGAELLSSAVPVSRAAKLRARANPGGKPPLVAALTDGEDFELLFTVASKDAVPLLDTWKARFPELTLSCIGKITREPGLRLRDKKGVQSLSLHGYVHFQKS